MVVHQGGEGGEGTIAGVGEDFVAVFVEFELRVWRSGLNKVSLVWLGVDEVVGMGGIGGLTKLDLMGIT